MILRLAAVLGTLGCLALAGPVSWDDSKCAQECNAGGSKKFQFSEQTSYIYSYHVSNELHADRTPELKTHLKGTLKVTAVSRCEMILEILDVESGASPSFSDQLRRNPLPFSWNEGEIKHVCPNPEDSMDVNNIKKGILSAFQNTMKALHIGTFNVDTDILGTCDTMYSSKEKGPEKYEILKTKNIPTCSDHLKGQTLLLASFYGSGASRQHLPFLSNEESTCKQVIEDGIVEEVTCEEKASFRPFGSYGYVVNVAGHSQLKKLSSEPASRVIYKAPKKESLVFKNRLQLQKNPNAESEARAILQHICESTKDVITKEAASYMHKLVYTIRQMDSASVENVYSAVKNNQICRGSKLKTVYLDALRRASSGGSIALLAKLINSGELSQFDSIVFFILLPFTSYVEEESISSALPLLQKGVANRHTLLGITALAHKYCSTNPECESTDAIKRLSSTLSQFLGDKCSSGRTAEETEILTALKAFGNLGFVGDSANALFDCALTATNKMSLRVAAIDSFRRSPCKEEIVSKLLNIHTNKNEHDEIRIAALMSLSKCGTKEIVNRVVDNYAQEPSNQVKVFTWSFLENLKSSSDPMKSRLGRYLSTVKIARPSSVDLTKFSRNFELSFFSEIFNLGTSKESNVVHSADSYLPKSFNYVDKLHLFGNTLELFQVGTRLEDLEHLLEKIFGPAGMLANVDVEDLVKLLPEHLVHRFRRSSGERESYQAKLDGLRDRLGQKRNVLPHGHAFLRIMGHEVALTHLNEDSLRILIRSVLSSDLLKNLLNFKDTNIDVSRNLVFLDVSVLFPSITGRAYRLAGNSSLTLGLKAEGNIDLRQPNFPIPQANIDAKFQPSILVDESASFTIDAEDFHPGVQAETVLNAGLDYQVKLELKDGRLFHVKLARNKKNSELLNFKRTLYYMNEGGKTEMQKPPSHNFNYCTKYLQKITGARYCASLAFPHAFESGKFKIPFVREMEASVTVEQTDPQMDGYEFLLELPDISLNAAERRFRVLVDIPNSRVDRKFALEVSLKAPDETCSLRVNLHTPFYTMEGNVQVVDRDDQFRLIADATGDGRRRYSLNVEAVKVTKGARLVEYQPRITLSLPSTRPVELTGTIVYSKGRKSNLAINLESASLSSPFTIKGNMAKEGESIDLNSNWKLSYEYQANVFSQIHRAHNSIGYDKEKGLSIDAGHHYEPDGRSYESVTANIKIDNIKIFERLSFRIDSEILFAEHQDINTMLKYDFSFRPLHHLKSDLEFRYGEDFKDDKHLVRSTIVSALHGDFNSFQKLSFENEIGLTISCFDFHKSGSLSVGWDFVDDPKLFVKAGIKTRADKEIKLDYNYRHLQKSPLKLATDFTVIYNTYKFKYKDEAVEVAPGKYEWKSVIEPAKGKEVTTDFIFRKVDAGEGSHFELDGTVKFPGLPENVHHKGVLKFSESQLKLSSETNFGRGQVYMIDFEIDKQLYQLKLNVPFVEGKLAVDARSSVKSVTADLKTKGRDNRRIIFSGKLTPGDTNTLDLDVQFDADRDPDKKVSIQLTSSTETDEGVKKYIIGGSVNYGNTIDISGTISSNLIRGPHFFRAEFAGNMEPMAIEIEHEIKEGHMNSVIRYLRSGVEKIRADVKGKLIIRGFTHFEIEGGVLTSSPYKTFDGKSLFFRLMADSTGEARTFVSEYRMKFSSDLGYEGKISYQRKRGWPGNVRANLIAKVHNRPIYEGSTDVDYGNGKYAWKTTFTPLSKRRINFLTSFEHSGRFVAFHHNLVTSLHYLQTVDLNAVADLRNMEDAKVHTNMDINSHKLYDVNSTLKMRSVIDFEAEATLFSKISPTVKIFSKTQASGQLTKYEFNLNVDSKDVITGSGEIKKRKRGMNGDLSFKYKEKEVLLVNIQQDGKGKHERNYLIKTKFPAYSRTYSASVKVNREKKGLANYDTKFCRNEVQCIEIDATHKELEHGYEWQVAYKRGDVEFSVERIRESSRGYERFHTVIYKGDNRFGYDVRFGIEGPGRSLSLGLILPSREIITKTTVEFSLSKPRLKLELSTDGKNHPDRKLITDIRFENHLRDSNPSKFDITVSHPIFEKPIDIVLFGDYEPHSSKYFTAGASIDYSVDPNDKLISHLSIEDLPGGTHEILVKLFHKDEQNQDVVMKMNSTSNSHEESVAVLYEWTDVGDKKAEAHVIASYLKEEKRFYFEYQRPKLHYKLEGKVASPHQSLLNDTVEINLESIYNGASTKGKLVTNYETGCHVLTLLSEGEESRIVEACINLSSRKMVSIITESVDDEGQWTFDYIMQIVLKDWNTIGVRQQMNPDFLGAKLFLITSLLDELDEAGVGTLPFHDSPRFKIIRKSLSSKIFEPVKNFIVPEAQKFAKDILNDGTILKQALIDYYQQLPSVEAVRERIQAVRAFIRTILYEVYLTVYSYYESYINTALEYANKVKNFVEDKCEANRDCKSLVAAFESEGWRGLIEELRKLLLALPDKIQEFLENPGTDVKNYLRSLFNIVKALLHPLTKYRCGEIVVKVVQLSYEALSPYVQTFLDHVPHYYKSIRQRLSTNEYVIASCELLKASYLKIRKEILSIDYKHLVTIARKYIEEYLETVNPPSKYIVVNAIVAEKGIVDVDIHSNVMNKIGARIRSLILRAAQCAKAGLHFNYNTLLVHLKRALDFGHVPPFDATAMIVGHQHFVTFDKAFYAFAGQCSYLLTSDFEDGNFTLALKPKEGDRASPSIVVIRGGTAVEISSGDSSVKVEDRSTELPFLNKEVSVERESNTILVNTKNGLEVRCNLVHEICSVVMSGYYYGKTAGLLGTYNYEQYDEFKRPKGQIANTVNAVAKSYELKRGCKTSNLVPDVQIDKNSNYYKSCKSTFVEDSSPLASCFYEVPPDEYFSLCLRHSAEKSDPTSALCNVAAAYVTECEKNYVELNVPSKCLTCEAPDNSKLEHGDRKKFENLSKKSADTVFLIQDHECNKLLVKDLSSLARSIERELENEGYRENMFGVVGFGGEIGDPKVFTAKGKMFMGSRDINSVTERFKLESKKAQGSLAFDSIKHAVTHLFRSDTAKSFVLIMCSACKFDLGSLQYPVVQQILLERGISLHVIKDTEIPLRKSSSKEKHVIGVDPDTVFHTNDVTQRDLVGEPNLRSQVVMPKDLCIALSQDVSGSFFSTHPMGGRAASNDVKNWKSVFARKLLKSTQPSACQWCDCTSTRDHLPKTVCQPCEVKRPRLPFSVGSSHAHARTLEAFISYLLHVIRE